jgi:hypothetical protein
VWSTTSGCRSSRALNLDRVVVEKRNQGVMERSLENLKDLVEAIKDYRAA